VKVALFTGNYNYVREGANQALNRLVSFLEQRCGHRVRVYSPTTSTPAFEPSGTLISVPSIALPLRSEFRLAKGLPSSIRKDVSAFEPDIFHVATPDVLGTRAVTMGRELRVPVVASLHTLFETYLEHYRLGWLRPAVEAHLRRFYRRSDHVLAPTPALVAHVRRIRDDWAASLWSRGVDRTVFHPGRRDLDWRRGLGIADDEVVVLFLGRLVLEKGVEKYASVLRSLKARGAPVRSLIVGEGPARGLLQALPGSILTGHLDGPALARAVASADILLHVSQTEAFGNVMLEAMASGVAVVAVDSGAGSTMIVNGLTGVICGSAEADCATAIMELVANPSERDRLGSAAAVASEAYSWDSASRSVAETYERLLRSRSRSITRA
jgi:phosphatidylinositol alpha 1,6-mannosyltransferase